MASVSVVDNKIRVTPGVGETGIIVTIIKKTLDIFDTIQDESISISDSINTTYDSSELQDGVYLVSLSAYSPANKIVFVTSSIEEQRCLFEIDVIKTKDMIGQKDYRIYYDHFQFAIQYDRLLSSIAAYEVISTIPFDSPEIINYFNTITNYFKYVIS